MCNALTEELFLLHRSPERVCRGLKADSDKEKEKYRLPSAAEIKASRVACVMGLKSDSVCCNLGGTVEL